MATALMTKKIEKEYSGTGKKTKGVGKLNFSATETFKCMEGITNYIFIYTSVINFI